MKNKNKLLGVIALAATTISLQTIAAPEAKPGEFVVRMKSANTLNVRAFTSSVSSSRELDEKTFLLTTKAPAQLLSNLKKTPGVAVVEPNYVYRAQELGWHLKNTGQADCGGLRGVAGVDVKAEDAWKITRGEKNVLVAVIDTGVDLENPRLKNSIAVNQVESAGVPGVDDDGNGYVDDIYGYDFVSKSGLATDEHGHGTFCASAIAAAPSAGDEIVGLAPGVSILPVRFLDENGSGTLADAVSSINYAVKRGAKVLSNSWGGGAYSKILEDSILAANEHGALFVAAGGNGSSDIGSSPVYPASYAISNVIAVAGNDNSGELSIWSNYGESGMHLSAPGANLSGLYLGNSSECLSGTSMAAPLVSATAALMLSKNPALTPEQMKAKLISSVTPLSSLRGKVVSGGMLNAFGALRGL